MSDSAFLQQVKQAIQQIDPQAEVWLFGSRARGDARPDSDWDFLMLTEKDVDRPYKYKVWNWLNDVELATQQVISTRIFNRANWRELAVTDLYKNVQTEQISREWSRYYTRLAEGRNDSDYEEFAVFTADDVLPLLLQTNEFISLIKGLIYPK